MRKRRCVNCDEELSDYEEGKICDECENEFESGVIA